MPISANKAIVSRLDALQRRPVPVRWRVQRIRRSMAPGQEESDDLFADGEQSATDADDTEELRCRRSPASSR